MQITQGTTPTITINVKSDIDLSNVTQVWVYIAQQNKVKVDKQIEDVSIDAQEKTITVRLEQDDTLELREGEALFQIRLLMADTTALATNAQKITIVKVYKGGVIKSE